MLDDKKRKYDEVDPLEPTFPEPKRTRKTEQTLYFEDDGGDDVDFDSYMETEQKKKRIVKQKKKKVKDQKADSHSKLSKEKGYYRKAEKSISIRLLEHYNL